MSIKSYCRLLALIIFMAAVSSHAYAAKNVIIMIGDGMGYQHVNAGSYYLTGAAGNLCFEKYYRCGVTTRSLNSSITDSAAAATALATGHKVNNGVISQAPDGSAYTTILEKAGAMGKRTGLVTTVPITHATPAGFGAHEADRNSYLNIGNDYLTSSHPDVIFGGGGTSGGGSGYFSTTQINTAISQGYAAAYNASQLNALPTGTNKALGLFNSGDMTYEYDRTAGNTEPHLSQMTAKSLDLLSGDPDGFFLMIEGGMIDHAAHNDDIYRTTREVTEFNNSVQAVLDWMQGRSDTLLIVTADHETGGLTATNMGAGNYAYATWTTTGHTGANVPFYITGANSDLVNGYITNGLIDNTDVFRIMDDAFVTPVPEPGSLSVLLFGFGGLVGCIMRRSREA